jgi:hypothetical protein
MRTFKQWTRAEFAAQVEAFDWRRRVTAVDMHHTWRPNHAQWQGRKSMEGMYTFHTRDNGWSDIAQHVTIAPDGTIWSGRDWNKSPASSARYNGNASAGPFMFETVGNFDKGFDKLEGEQLETVLFVITTIQKKFRLPPTSLRFHRQLGSPKTCPGSAIDYDLFVKAVTARHNAAAPVAAIEPKWAPERPPQPSVTSKLKKWLTWPFA